MKKKLAPALDPSRPTFSLFPSLHSSGYDGLLSAAASASAPKRSTPRADDRIFSLSSATGAAHKGGGGDVV